MHSRNDRLPGLHDSIRWIRLHPRLTTVVLTVLTACAMMLSVVFVRVDTRNASGEHREMRVIEVWGTMLDNLPRQSPDPLGREVLAVLLVVALIAGAYIIVATWRLPR